MNPRTLTAIVALMTSVACGARADGPPDIEVDRTACSHCGMLVSEPAYAAAYRSDGHPSRVFDDIKCLLAAAIREPDADRLRVWVHDAATAAWIDGTEATFVTSPTLRTPMGGGSIAFRDPAAAREAAARHGGTVSGSLAQLRNQAAARQLP